MDWKTFFATLIGHLSWPSVAAFVIFLIRRQLVGLAERIEEIALPGGASAKFGKALEAGRSELEQVVSEAPVATTEPMSPNSELLELANKFPEAAVLESYSALEKTLIRLRSILELPPQTNMPSVIRHLVQRGSADAEVEALFNSVRQARNAAAHGRGANRIAPGEAAEYIYQVGYLEAYFETVLKMLERPQAP